MDSVNNPETKYYLIIQLINASLGCAKEKIAEDPTYLFRIQFHYKNFEQENDSGIKIKSQKRTLKEGLMDFHKEIIFFEKISRYKGQLEMRMMLGSDKKGKQFKPTIVYIHTLKLMEEDIVTWKFPAESNLTIKYKLTNNLEAIREFCKKYKVGNNEIKIPLPRNDNLNMTFDIGAFSNINKDNDIKKENNPISSIKTFKSDSKVYEMVPIKDDNTINLGFKAKLSMYEQFSKLNTTTSFRKSFMSSSSSLNKSLTQTDQPAIIPLKPTTLASKNDLSPIKVEEDNFVGFCEGFFVSSFSFLEGKILENSQSYSAMCGHVPCSILPAMEPEIIYRYPLEDTKELELNNLVASICFPSGIKVCYNQDRRSTYKNYFTPITNQQGARYYMMTYHFYQEIDTEKYDKKYVNHPLKHFLRKFGDNFFETENEKNKLENDLKICEVFGYMNNVYVPFCISLISRYPYIKQMEQCLEQIFQILTSKENINNHNINDLITYFIKSVPVPPYKSEIKFTIPFSEREIELYHPSSSNITNKNLWLILDYFSVENIILIYSLLFFESKILFIDREYNRQCQIVESFLSLLYPIEWINTCIPIMSEQMTRYLQTFLPFVNAINDNLYENNAKSALSEAEEGIFLIFIGKNGIHYSKDNFQRQNLAPIPKEIQEKLSRELNSLKSILNNLSKEEKEKNLKWVNLYIQNLFLEAFCLMFYDCMDYLYSIDDDYTVFNTEMLLKNRNQSEAAFYKEVTETQIFQNFIQNFTKDQRNYYYFLSVLSSIKEQKSKGASLKKKISNINDVISSVESSSLYSCIKINDSINSIYIINQIGNISKAEKIQSQQCVEHVNEIDNANYKSDKEIIRYIFPNILKKASTKISASIITKADIYERRNQKKLGKEAQELSTNYCKKKLINDFELSTKDKEEIIENMKDAISFIFKSDFQNIHLEKVIKEIYTSTGRDIFCKLFYQPNFSIKKIEEECFENLNKLARNALISLCNINETEKTVDNAVIITKSSFYYCKGNKEKVLLIDELVRQLKEYFLWVKDSFWDRWLKMSIKEHENKGDHQIIVNNDDTYSDLFLKDISLKMLRMKINKEYIISYSSKVLNKKIIDPERYDKIRLELINIVTKNKYT